MTELSARIIYIHGFNSSPDSQKARSVYHYCQQHLPATPVSIPELSFDPQTAMASLVELLTQDAQKPALLIGSSLGGYYATWLAEKYNLKAVLVNPAVAPTRTLGKEFLGHHVNMYTGQEYELTMSHVDYLATLEVETLRDPGNYLLLVQTGDEVLDYRLAVAKYKDSRQIVQPGGSHAFDHFSDMLPEILSFAGPNK